MATMPTLPSEGSEQPGLVSPPIYDDALRIEGSTRLKGRQRLLKGLQRISSSPSLAQFGRRRATSNPYGGRSTISCVSLASPNSSFNQNYGESASSQSTAGQYSTAPTSRPSTGVSTPLSGGFHARLAIRRVDTSSLTPTSAIPTSIPLPTDIRPASRHTPTLLTHHESLEYAEDYFSHPITIQPTRKTRFDFWSLMPNELRLSIFRHLTPKELVRASVVCKDFHNTCFDGQLWTRFDASEFYTEIPAEALAKIIVSAGPFVKDLNLRGCVQVEHYKRAEVVVHACKNLINATLEGCRNFQRSTLHHLLTSNERLAHLNLTGLTAVNNGTCKIVARSCPQLEHFNVSWCTHMDSRGIKMVLEACPRLKDLRAGEIRGFGGEDVALAIFNTNNLERLVLSGCSDLDDEALKIMIHGIDPEMDVLENRPLVQARKLRHLDLSRCNQLTDEGVKALAWNVPALEGLLLGGCTALTDKALENILASTPHLSHLDLEDLAELTNSILSQHLAKAPCAQRLEHLSIGYCENLGDSGMLPVIRACTRLKNLEMDNTRISNLVLAEVASLLRTCSTRPQPKFARPWEGLHIVVYDCQNVTWTGIREVLSCNAAASKPKINMEGAAVISREIIGLKCYYGWQMTVDEHTKRVLRGDVAAAARLERKWVGYMMANEEAGAGGAGMRRRRRRAREAAMLHADEEDGGEGMTGIGRRRRARSGGCTVM